MCSGDRDELIWSVRRRDSGELVTTRDGLAYYFTEEEDAAALRHRLGLDDLADVVWFPAGRDLA